MGYTAHSSLTGARCLGSPTFTIVAVLGSASKARQACAGWAGLGTLVEKGRKGGREDKGKGEKDKPTKSS